MFKLSFVLMVLLLSIASVSARESSTQFSRGIVVFKEQNATFKVEIAKTRRQRAAGLMFRINMPKNNGMLFIFDSSKIQSVWMKNTLLALDVAFISEQGEIVSVLKDLQPCKKAARCQIYASTGPVRYMLELNTGVFEKNDIKAGDLVKFESMTEGDLGD